MGMPARVLEERVGLRDVVRQSLEECENDRERACGLATQRVLEDPDLARAVVAEAVREGVDDLIHGHYVQQRHRALAGQMKEIRGKARLRVAEALKSLADFPLPSGVALRNACRAEIRSAAEHWLKQGTTMVTRGLWLRSVADAMKDDETPAGQALKAKRLKALWGEAQKRVETWGL